MNLIDLTPDPKVLIALTHTPMQPMDALCELIDNAIDSFEVARITGEPIHYPMIIIDLPRPSELVKCEGVLRIRDNGPGLTKEMAEKAIRAGYSGNNPYDSLGLFGMGFNISTGKLGRETRLLTVSKGLDKAMEVIIDLESIQKSRSYKVPFSYSEKPAGFDSGTLLEISKWWPEGNANSGFIRKLVQYGMPTVRKEIGRRYATILRQGNIRIIINDEPCEAFEHCYWDDSRYVERRGHGKIPAVYRFNELIGTQKRCVLCTALVLPGKTECPSCGSSSLRTIEERIRGWVGVQRFDDTTEFGVDLIRNGRAIRIGEKSAFFDYVDEFKRMVKDYPIDSQYGRIIGEVHLNHVPVDFLKQDYQRSSPEWQRAMSYIRGDSSLQPNQPNADKNISPIYMLYQGYRRVRTPGKTDMYMGYWDQDDDKAKRISRDKEKEFYEKFKKKVPGFYDDSEWWKLVEQADTRPLEELIECPDCMAQNLKEHDTCAVCGCVLIGKHCIHVDCGQIIPQSAMKCPYCGISQEPIVEEPWTCQVCGVRNSANREACESCGEVKGSINSLSFDFLYSNSNKADDLSISGCSVLLANDEHSTPIDVDVYVTNGPIIPNNNPDKQIPLIAFKGERIEIFIDKTHRLFRSFRVCPEMAISSEIALYIYDMNRRLSGQQFQGLHTLANLEWSIMNTYWAESLEDSIEKIRETIQAFFDQLRMKLLSLLGESSVDYFDDMNEEQKKQLINNMLDQGIDIGKIGELKNSGKYLNYVDEDTILNIFKKSPSTFFDQKFWKTPYSSISDLPEAVIEQAQDRIFSTYMNCLEDVVSYLRNRSPESIINQRAKLSLEFLLQKVI